MAFRVLIIGGTGQVGAAVVRALAAEPSSAEVVMVNRRAVSLTGAPRVRQVILDTAAARFPADVTSLAQSMVAHGDPVYGASCVGVGKGSLNWSEEELKALEIGVAGGFARGCHDAGITRFALLSAVGSTSPTFSRGTTRSISGTAGADVRVTQITSMSNALALRAMSWPMRPMPSITMRAPSGAIM